MATVTFTIKLRMKETTTERQVGKRARARESERERKSLQFVIAIKYFLSFVIVGVCSFRVSCQTTI